MAIGDLVSELSTTTSVGITVLGLLLIYIYKGSGKPEGSPPGPPALPIAASLPFVSFDDYMNSMLELHKRYGDVFSIKLPNRLLVVVKGYELLKEVMVKRGTEFAGRAPMDSSVRMSIMSADGENMGIIFGDYCDQWKLQRHTSMTILRNLGYGKNRLQGIIAEEAQELCKLMTAKEGTVLDLCDLISGSNSNVICALLFGERYDHSDKEFQSLRKCISEIFEMLDQDLELDLFAFLRFLPHYKGRLAKFTEMNEYLHAIIRKKIQARKVNEEGEPRDFIEGYLKALKENKDLEDWSSLITEDFFVAGSETTSTTLGWAFYYMIAHPEIQAKVQAELDQVVGRSREVTLKDKENLPYAEACVAEILRIACTAPFTIDHRATQDTQINGYKIPKDTLIWGNLWAVLRDPEVFPEPDTCRPERFIQEDGTFKRHEQIINFGTGRRSCMGEQLARQELFLFFTHILQKFRLSVPEGQTHPPPKGVFAFTHRPPIYNVVAHIRI